MALEVVKNTGECRTCKWWKHEHPYGYKFAGWCDNPEVDQRVFAADGWTIREDFGCNFWEMTNAPK